MGKRIFTMSIVTIFGLAASAHGGELEVTMHEVTAQGVGKEFGTVHFVDSTNTDLGLLIIPRLSGLGEGAHGFHVHENPDCGPSTRNGEVVPGGAAGGHYDPQNTGKHEGPAGNGHLGDMPELIAGPDGGTPVAMYAPRLQTTDLAGRAVIVHKHGDNYSDEPKPLGGGGSRVACGVVDF